MLLTYIGDESYEVYENVRPSDTATFKEVIEAFDKHFTPQTNTSYETFLFRNLKQKDGESLNEFYIRLKEQSTKCSFENVDLNIKQQIELSTNIDKLRLYSFQHPDKTLQELLTIGRTYEATTKQIQEISKKKVSDEEIFYTKNRRKFAVKDAGKNQFRRGMSTGQKSCYKCGGKFPHKYNCPAEGKTCNKCHKINHFAVVCRSNKARGNFNKFKSRKKPLNSLDDTTHSSSETSLYENMESLDLDEILFTVKETAEPGEKAVCDKNSRPARLSVIRTLDLRLLRICLTRALSQ